MLTATVNCPTRRAPSPEIGARDTSLDGTANGSAGVNSAPNVDAGVNGATHLGGQRCGDHEDRDHRTSYRKFAEHNFSLPWAQITSFRQVECINLSLCPGALAATNKCLAKSNKSSLNHLTPSAR